MKSFIPLNFVLLCILSILNDVEAFTIPSKQHTKPRQGNAAVSSALFRGPTNIISTCSRRVQGPIFVPTSMTKLQMAEDQEEEKPIEITEVSIGESAQVGKEENKKGKERSGFLTALIVGPPLIAKFAIVLMVKFLTDVIVFPLLFLYRMCKSLKNRIVGLFGKDDAMKGDGVNGTNGSS